VTAGIKVAEQIKKGQIPNREARSKDSSDARNLAGPLGCIARTTFHSNYKGLTRLETHCGFAPELQKEYAGLRTALAQVFHGASSQNIFLEQFESQEQEILRIHSEHLDGCAAAGRRANKACALKAKVIFPQIGSWMK
jgi:hypothetical protein